MDTQLYEWQVEALQNMHNGCILCGSVGSGKSRTSLAYTYIYELGGSLKINGKGQWTEPELPKDLYIITTAKKRDTLEWEEEVSYFCLPKYVNIVIDSWNNIQKYKSVIGAMFIFDEQRVVGKGAWVKSFLKITRANHWILLSATPGDTWQDYIPVFLANRFYKSRTEFNETHVIYKPYMKFPMIDHYVGVKRLEFYRKQVVVMMNYKHDISKTNIEIQCEYDKEKYKRVFRDRWNVYDNCPIEETGKLCYLLRRVSNDDPSRYAKLDELLNAKNTAIIFYNYSYELYALRQLCEAKGYTIGEWNGEKHTPVPDTKRWIYLCQYTAASEGWNCITTDTIIFFSQNYSYKIMEQAAGRIDRLNTPFKELFYYHFKSHSQIDLAINRALQQKRNFNEKLFVRGIEFELKGESK